MDSIPKETLEIQGDDILVDADMLALQLSLSVAALRERMNAGKIRTLVERGEGEDEGRLRLTFRWAGQQFSIMREPDGALHQTDPPPPERRPVRPSIMQLMDSGYNH